ncbi:AAA family ATPase [Burkholderia ubonensis]|uniref:AAA family ATPase n=1 Tax=Burkholderia ubonensis TaxID=101571 RepID=UPI0012FB160F|nr:AAA family ATPase [Burkholderia ubonensis]
MYARATLTGVKKQMEQPTTQDAKLAATQPSIVEYFGIEGLFGYRSISLSSKFAATVLIARNGSGKTTLLAALDAFLRGQFSRFVGLQFETITCRLRGCVEPLILQRSDVEQLADFSINSEIAARAKGWDVSPLALLALVESVTKTSSYPELMDDPTFYSIYTKSAYSWEVAKKQCLQLAEVMEKKYKSIFFLRNSLRVILGDTQIVYLPTYRRIELSLPEPDSRRGERRKSVLSKLGVARSGLHTADIQFGLGDISDRLKAIYSEMLFLSNQGYGKVSANVINDLISGGYKREGSSPAVLPSQESLEIFFSRIKDASREYGRGMAYGGFFVTPDLARVYRGDVPEDARPFLGYFLNQLNSVIQQTRGYEELVEAFIGSCNKYLSGGDHSTDVFSNGDGDVFDYKVLQFNRRNLDVKVVSAIMSGRGGDDDEIPLDALSSGEKQMISLFARLYLYPGKKIVLIDEPELSLSLDWQRQILPDILKAPLCQQAIAITHSPFIFDNELEPFAGSLKFRVNPKGRGARMRRLDVDAEGDFNE